VCFGGGLACGRLRIVFTLVQARVEATLAYVGNLGANRVTLRLTGGALAQQRTAGSTVNVALLGQNFAATTPDRDRAGLR
jgi:hypothetical protein